MDLERYYTALRNAHADGNTEAATKIANEIRRIRAMGDTPTGGAAPAPDRAPLPSGPAPEQPPLPSGPAPEQSPFAAALSGRRGIRAGDAMPEVTMREGAGPLATGIVNNVIGMGEVDSFGERMGEDMNQMGVEENVAPLPLPENRRQQVLQTVGSYLPAAAATGGGILGLLKNAVAPALGSEGAGYLTEGTALEPWARFGGAIAGQIAGNVAANAFRPQTGPADFSRALGADDAEQVRLGQTLENAGVRPTVGQATGNRTLASMEGMASPSLEQLDDFTAAALRSSGSTHTRATPEALREMYRVSTQAMDDVLGNTAIRSNPSLGARAAAIADDFMMDAPKDGAFGGRVNDITKTLIENANTNKTFSLETLRTWRSALGKMTTSPDGATQQAAVALRGLIDDATDEALRAAGRGDDIAKLATSRVMFRDWLTFVDASTRAGAETGILSPQALNAAVIRQAGRRAVATGVGTTPLADLSRAGANVLRPAPTVTAGGVRAVQGALPTGGAGIGGALGYSVGGPVGAGIGGAMGAVAPMVGSAALRSGAIQNILRDPASLPNAGLRITSGQTGVSGMQRAQVDALQEAGYPSEAIAQIMRGGPEAVTQALQGR